VQQSVAKVRADLTAIQPNSQVTAQQKQQLAKDLLATAQGANKPSSATIAALAEELSSALVQKPLPDKDRNRLLTDLAAVLNPANIQPTQMQAIFGDIQAIFQVNGIARKDAVKITDAVKAVAAETRH
jgi:type VI protein secretion system component VasK